MPSKQLWYDILVHNPTLRNGVTSLPFLLSVEVLSRPRAGTIRENSQKGGGGCCETALTVSQHCKKLIILLQ